MIALAASVLLVSDVHSRKSNRSKGSASASSAPADKSFKIAILQYTSQVIMEDGVKGMIEGLAENGLVEGRNLSIQHYNAEGDIPTANAIAGEITSGRFDLVLTTGTPALQAVAHANKAGKTIQVFALVTDPYAAGVGVNPTNHLDHPRWLAGFGTMQPVENSFKIARQMNPGLKTVGVVWNASEVNSQITVKVARQVCQDLGITLLEATVDNSSAVYEAANSLVARGVEALWIGGDNTVLAAAESMIQAARKGKIPVFTVIPPTVEKGALFDLGANYHSVGKLAGNLAGEILNGRDPASVPIDNVVPEMFAVNQLALQGLKDDWKIPTDLQAKADLVVDASGVHRKAGDIPRPPPGQIFKIGVAYFGPDPGADSDLQGLLDGLKALGFEEGKNLQVRKMHAQGEISNIPGMLQTLDNSDVDVIIPMSTPCITAACGLVKQKPVVFTYCYDPIAAGVGTSFTNHLPFMTGIGSFPPVGDTIDLIQKLVPGVTAVGTLYNSSEANSRKVMEVARGLFAQHGIKLEETAIANSSEVYQAAQALVSRNIQAVWITGDNTALQAFEGIVKNTRAAKLPLIINDPEFTARGALACVGLGFYQTGLATAEPLARVLMGENPRDIPIENVSVKTLVLNQDVAKILGVTFPEDLVKQAAAQDAARGASAPLAKKWRIAELSYSETPVVEQAVAGVAAGLRESGLVEGRDYELTLRNAQGDMPTLNGLVDASLTDGADLLLTATTPALQASLKRAPNLPIIFTLVANPFIAGAGKTDQDHQSNVSGCYFVSPFDEMMTGLKQCLPGVKRIGTLFNPAEINSVFFKEKLTAAAQRAGLEVEAVGVSSSGEVPDAALALCDRNIDAFCQISDSLSGSTFASIVQAAKRAHVPLFSFSSSQAEQGAVMCVARDYFDNGRQSALMAARVMRGEDPAAIPFQQMQGTKWFVNLQAAAANGITIPDSLVKKADEVIGTDGKPVVAGKKAAPPAAPVPLAKKWNIHIIEYVQVVDVEDTERGLYAGFDRAGLVRGRDYEVTVSNAHNDMPTLSGLVDAAVTDGADLIITVSTPALQAAIRRAGSIPIVFTYCANARIAGAATSLTDHLPNLTGVESPGAYKELVEIVRECLPGVQSIGTIFAPSEVNTVFHKEQITKVATAMGIKVETVAAETSPEVSDAALALSNRRIDAICQIGGNLTAASFPSIARAAYSAKLPLFASLSSQAEAGAAVVVARDYYDSGIDTGLMVARVMRGEKTASIPIEQFSKSKIIVNLTGAKACGLTVPPAVLARADVVIGGKK